jgi:hypothetical protein
MTAFILACYMNGVLQGSIYFKSVNDCTYYKKILNNQEFIEDKKYNCICKLEATVDPNRVRVY